MRPRRYYFVSGEPSTIACVACLVAGFGMGFGSGFIWPWGFARAPGDLELATPDDRPRPGLVLSAGDESALVLSRSVVPLRDGSYLGAIKWVRGPRSGIELARASGCDKGEGRITPLDRPGDATPWWVGSRGMLPMLAEAICFEALPPPGQPRA